MQQHHSITKLIGICSALLLTLVLTPFCFGQTKAAEKSDAPAPRQLLSVQYVRIKPGMRTEWIEFRKNETLPMLHKAGVKNQVVWNASVFGESVSNYLIITPIDNWANFDGPAWAVKALGEEAARAYRTKSASFIESSHTIAIETRPELSFQPTGQPKLMVLTETVIENGYNTEYENFVKTKFLPLAKKANPKGYRVSRVIYGGNLNLYRGAALVDSFEELGKYREALAKEMAAAKYSSKGVGIVSRENAVYRFVPELSIVPAPVTTANK
ncbi:MAG TPA: hypothetical protein VFZ34_19915 [Blastocatellia bacterium]|nr:hypothetical protein [Blastocatellia bacterium]